MGNATITPPRPSRPSTFDAFFRRQILTLPDPNPPLAYGRRRPSGRQRRHRARRRRAAPQRDWADGLPLDVVLNILVRLDHIDILMTADRVCRTWRRAARDEPALWRRICMLGYEGIADQMNHGGQCEEFIGQYAGDDAFLIYLTEQAPYLKSLRLISCHDVTKEGLTQALKKLPLLEELELSLCYNVCRSSRYKFVAKICPQLKCFRLNRNGYHAANDNLDTSGIATMHGLRFLQLVGNCLTNNGLETILDNCPQLESLDIRHCCSLDMDESLILKCARIETVRLPDDPTDDYHLQVESPVRDYCRDCLWGFCCLDFDDDVYYDFYCEPSRFEDDLDRYNNDKMIPFSMRTLLTI